MDSLAGEFKEALDASSRHRGEPEDHPAPEKLAAYQAGKLTDSEVEGLQDHLIWCKACTAQLLGLEALLHTEQDESSALREETEWRSLRQQLKEMPSEGAGRSPLAFPSTRSRLPRRWLHVVAASLLVTTLGLSVWVEQLRRTVATISEPQINIAIRDVLGDDVVRGNDTAVPNQVPIDAQPVTLILSPVKVPSFSDYRLTLELLNGRELWQRQGLEKSQWDTFTLMLPAGFLKPGQYRLRLDGLEGDRWQLIEAFSLHTADPL